MWYNVYRECWQREGASGDGTNRLAKTSGNGPEYPHGEPCIRDLLSPVTMIVGRLAAGMSFEDILPEYR